MTKKTLVSIDSFKALVKPHLTEKEYDNFNRAFNEAWDNRVYDENLYDADCPSEVILAAFSWPSCNYPEHGKNNHNYWDNIWKRLLESEMRIDYNG